MKKHCAALERFPDVVALLGYLVRAQVNLDEETVVYKALVQVAQARGDHGELATAILMLALWPGLDAIFRRSFRCFLDDDVEVAATELTSEIAVRFTSVVGSADLSRISKIAATLVLNTERAVVESRRRLWKDIARHTNEPEDEILTGGAPEPSDLGMAPGHSVDEELAAIRGWLTALVGRDAAELVIAAVIEGEQQGEAGKRLGLAPEVARKRFQTALSRIREHFRKI
jgi:RNA polymerase sigma-70 factor (ECF subfamily)